MGSDAKMRVLMGPVGCVSGSTLVVTEFGPLPISQIDRPMRVLSWSDKTNQFQLSWCGGAFPKGKDYLVRVSTPRGGFDASEHHQMLCEGGDYQPVSGLSCGQPIPLCSADPVALCSELVRRASLPDAPRLSKTGVGFLDYYAKLNRLRGQQFQLEEGSDQELFPLPTDAQILASFADLIAALRKGDLEELLEEHNHHGLPFDHIQTGDCLAPAGLPRLAVVGCAEVVSSTHNGDQRQASQQSAQMSECHLTDELSLAYSSSCSSPLSNGTITNLERKDVQELYWDMQVLETNNYVLIDGTINHNSGKSVTCCFEIIKRASEQAPNARGIRKTRFAVVRQTVRQLADTTIKTFLDWFPPGVCGHFMRTTKTYFFKVGDIECEVMFRALDDANDVANLNSLELTGAWFNECRDIAPEIIDAMSKRIGRFPSSKDGGPSWYGMWGDTNPPIMDTWWYYQMEKIKPEDGVSPNDNGWDVFKQPSGRSPYAENIENLPEGYYDTQGRSDDYIRVFIDGEYGLSLAGTPVYKYFKPDYHMAKEAIRPIISGLRPVVVGIDLGLTPAAVIGQQDPRGRMLILADAVSFDMGIQRFSRTVLKPLLVERFPGLPVRVIVDPAGVQRAQTDERSAVDILKAEGFKVIPARTNSTSARLNAVDDYLMRQVDGDPAFLMDPRCARLKAAMMGGYRYHPKTGNVEKNNHSHVAEALQYLALHIAAGGESALVGKVREVKQLSPAGWT